MDKNLADYTDSWEMVCSFDLRPHKSGLYTFALLYCKYIKAAPTSQTKSVEITNSVKAVWDAVGNKVVEHPSVYSEDSESTEAVQYFLSLPWAQKSYAKYAKAVHSHGRLATKIRANNWGWAAYPLLVLLDVANLFVKKHPVLARIQADFEWRYKPTPVSAIMHLLMKKAEPTLVESLNNNKFIPPIENYLKNLRK